MTEQNGTSQPINTVRRRRLLYAVVFAVVVLGLLAALLPALASTRMGTNVVQALVNGSIIGSVRIDDLDVAWSKGQHVTGLTLFAPDGAVALTVEQIAAPDLSLWSLLRGSLQLGRINVEKAKGRIDRIMQVTAGLESTHDAPGRVRDTSRPRGRPDISVTLGIDDAQLVYAGEHIETVEISVSKAEVDIPSPRQIKLNFESQVSLVLPDSDNKSPVKGTIHADCTVHRLFDEQWQLQWHAVQFENSVVDITNVPVTALSVILQYTRTENIESAFLARLLGLKGALAALFGSTLEAHLGANGDVESLTASFSIVSDKLDIAGQLASRDGMIVASQQPGMSWRIDQEAWGVLRHVLPSLKDTQLVESFDMTAEMKAVNIILADRGPLWISSSLSGSAKVDGIQLRTAGPVGDIELKAPRLNLHADQLGKQIDVEFSALAVQGNYQGRIEAGIVVKNATDAESKLDLASADITAEGHFKDIPTAMIEQFVAYSEGLANPAIGRTVNMSVSARRSPREGDVLPEWRYHCTVTADRLDASVKGRVSESRFMADHGFADLNLAPRFVEGVVRFLANANGVSTGRGVAAGPLRIHVDINDIAVQKNVLETGAFTGTLKVAIDDMATTLVEYFVPQIEGLSRLAAGPKVNVSLSVVGGGQSAQPKYSAMISADHVKIESGGVFDEAGLSQSHVNVRWTLSPGLVSVISNRFAGDLGKQWKNLSLNVPAQVNASFTDVALPFDLFSLDEVSGLVVIEVQEIEPAGVPVLKDIALRYLRMELPIASASKSASFAGKAYLSHGRNVAELKASGSISLPFKAKRTVDAVITGKALPLELIEQLIDQPGSLQPLLGEQVDYLEITVRNEAAHPDQWSLGATVRSKDRLNAQLTGVYSPGRSLVVTEGSQVELVVTPQAYASWTLRSTNQSQDKQDGHDFNLVEPAQLKLDVRRVQLGFKSKEHGSDADPTGLDFTTAAIDCELLVPKAEFTYRLGHEKRQLSLRDVKVRLDTAMLQKGVKLKLDGSVQAMDPVTGDRQTSPLRSVTELTNLFDQQGHLSISGLRVRTDTHLANLPMPLIDQFAGMDGKLSAVIGPVAQFVASGNYPGGLSLGLKSDTADILLPLEIDQHRQVTLNDDVHASLMLTEESVIALFGNIHPALRDAVASKEPIRLTIKKNPFNLPLQQLSKNIDELTLDATLEIGTLQMRRRGWLSEGLGDLASFAANIAKLARMTAGHRDQVGTYDAMFTPMRIQVRNGRLKVSEVWMVSQDMAVGFQGGANLVNQRYRFTMGLLGASMVVEEPLLAQIIDPTNIYDVPVVGRVGGKPVIDKREFEIAVIGSTVKQQIGRAGDEAKLLIDMIGGHIQDTRRKKAGLSWNMPQAAVDFQNSIIGKGHDRSGDKNDGQGQDGASAEPQQSGQEGQGGDISNLLGDIFEHIKREYED